MTHPHSRPAIYPIDLLRRVRDARIVRNADRLVLDALILRADWNDYSAAMSISQLMLDTLLDESEVIAALARLKTMRLIEIEPRRYMSTIFRVSADRICGHAAETRLAQQMIEATR